MKDDIQLTDIEVKKEFLNAYQKAKRDIIRLEEQLKELRSSKISISMNNDGMPHGSKISDLSDYAVKVEEIEEQINSAKYNRILVFQHIRQNIENMEDEREKTLLTYRYLQGIKWEEICIKMNYKWRQVHRIHHLALKNIKMA